MPLHLPGTRSLTSAAAAFVDFFGPFLTELAERDLAQTRRS